MRTRTVLSAAVLGFVFVGGQAAKAADGPSIGVQDKDVHAGQAVAVVASCDAANFAGGKVTSTALQAEDLGSTEAGEQAYTSAHVKPDTKPGKYTLSFTCNGKNVSGTFDVTAGAATGDEDVLPISDQWTEEDVVVAAEKPAESTNYGLYALEGAGVLALGGAVFFIARRARRA